MDTEPTIKYLFDSALLEKLDWDERSVQFKDNVCPLSPGKNLQCRPLAESDFHKGYMQLMSQLTSIGDVTEDKFISRFHEMKKCNDTYYIAVLEDLSRGQIIGSASLVIEQKFIRSASLRGRIEDIVVSDEYRGKQLGKLLVQTMTLLGKKLGCYKLSLECHDDKKTFYETFQYKNDGQHFMVQYCKANMASKQ